MRDRKAAEEAGRTAETVALWYLRLKGWRLLSRRYKCAFGEVDLIMRKGETTAFIEVKARATLDGAVESVSPRQARRISAAARSFLLKTARHICRPAVLTSSR